MTQRATIAGLTNDAANDVWGEPCAVAGQDCNGILDEVWIEVSAGGEVPQSALRPVLDVVLADLPIAPAQGDTVTARGETFTVVDVQRDGNDGAKLILQRA